MTLPRTTLAWVHQGLVIRESNSSPHSNPSLRFQDLLRLEERTLPKLGIGMALVRVDGAPVNPSDTLYVQGRYGVQPKRGDVPGFEGCGTVLAANAGPYGWWLKGKRVSFGSQDGNGSWAQYVVVSAFSCIPVSKQLPVEAAATLIVNPMTALGLIARVKRQRSKAFVVNAAGSALGRYLISLAKLHHLTMIGLVRREETKQELLQLGASHVLNTNQPDFHESFARLCQSCQPRVLLDAVAGSHTAQLMNSMPDQSVAVVYGKLNHDSEDSPTQVSPVSADADGLVFRKQQVEGYWLTHELHGLNGILTPLLRARTIGQLYRRGIFQTGPILNAKLEDLVTKMENPTPGTKLLFSPDAASITEINGRVDSQATSHLKLHSKNENLISSQN